jgi:uncharacterized protein YceK
MKKKTIVMAFFAVFCLLMGCATINETTGGGKEGPADSGKYDRAGFETRIDKDGRLWVFIPGSKDLAVYDAKGSPAKHSVRPLAGPGNITMKTASDSNVIDAYLLACPGFVTRIDAKGSLWVFEAGSGKWKEYDSKGAPAKHIVRPLAGPERRTLRAEEAEILDGYMKAAQYNQ